MEKLFAINVINLSLSPFSIFLKWELLLQEQELLLLERRVRIRTKTTTTVLMIMAVGVVVVVPPLILSDPSSQATAASW